MEYSRMEKDMVSDSFKRSEIERLNLDLKGFLIREKAFGFKSEGIEV